MYIFFSFRAAYAAQHSKNTPAGRIEAAQLRMAAAPERRGAKMREGGREG